MTERTSADALLTETTSPPATPPLAATHVIVDPAAEIDPAAKLDPAKAKPKAARVRKPRPRKPTKKAVAAKAKAGTAASVAAMHGGKAKKAATAHATAADDELRAAYAAAEAHEVGSFADLPERDELLLRLADVGHFVAGAIEAARADFGPGGQGVTFTKPVDIGPDCDPVRVVEAWVVASSGPAVRCPVGPLSGGNGQHAQIPAGHLKF